MMPVEATRTSAGERPSSLAVASAIDMALRWPWAPVQALALPLFPTTALIVPLLTVSRLNLTGAATIWLVVKRAAVRAGRSDSRRARSQPPCLMPQAQAPARKPEGATTPPGISWYLVMDVGAGPTQKMADFQLA